MVAGVGDEQVARASKARPRGSSSFMAVAVPGPSPVCPATPVPAMVVIVPLVSTLRMTWLPVSAMYEVASAVHGDALWRIQLRVNGRAPVAGVALNASASDSRDQFVIAAVHDAIRPRIDLSGCGGAPYRPRRCARRRLLRGGRGQRAPRSPASGRRPPGRPLPER